MSDVPSNHIVSCVSHRILEHRVVEEVVAETGKPREVLEVKKHEAILSTGARTGDKLPSRGVIVGIGVKDTI